MLFVFLGDSITEGLGVKRSRKNYGDLLKNKLQSKFSRVVNVVNFGSSAMQINQSRERFENKIIDLAPDVVVIAHGITEAIVRPRTKYLKYLPKRWRRPGWMDPRPYYSSRLLTKWMQKIESGARWRCKAALIKIFGGETWMSLEQFNKNITEFVQLLLNHNDKLNIIFLSPSDIEDKYFPFSQESIKRYREELIKIQLQFQYTKRVHMCDASKHLQKWEDYQDDRFHPNESGHDKIAEALLDTIVQNGLVNIKLLEEVGQ